MANERASSRKYFSLAFALTIGWWNGPSGIAQSVPEVGARESAERVFKNIQVFKGLPADQLLPIMQFISGSLGVHCYHCHDQDVAKRDDDAKATKLVARKMVQMVADINRTAFGGRKVVTCYSCHRGSIHVAKPVAFDPDLHSAPSPQDVAALPAPVVASTVDQLIEKYVTALGGADALRKVSSRFQRGTLTEIAPGEPPAKHPVEILAQGREKNFLVTHMKDGDAIAVYNGSAGWFLFAGNRLFNSTGRIWDFPVPYERLRGMRSEELQATQLGDPIYLVGQVGQLLTGLGVVGMETIGGRETYVVSGHTPNLPIVKLHLDKQSGLLARLAYETETPLGPIPRKVDYADYRDVGGVKVPFQWTASDMREAWLYQMDEVKHSVGVDESKFRKPQSLP